MSRALAKKASPFSLSHKLGRFLWNGVWLVLFRPSPRCCNGWRRFLLRLFGATMSASARAYPKARIWAPWNLVMEEETCLGDDVDCYTMDKVVLRSHATVSQYAFLCTGTHDYQDLSLPLVTAPIEIKAHAWVTADVFVGPGVTVGEGAVIAARSSVYNDVEPWVIVAGNPAKMIKKRELYEPYEAVTEE